MRSIWKNIDDGDGANEGIAWMKVKAIESRWWQMKIIGFKGVEKR